ncbi:DUF6387 family protein [Colwelliaceae bacterium BS250]
MNKSTTKDYLSWYSEQNYSELESLTLLELTLELKVRVAINKSKVLDGETDFNYWMGQIINGNPILSKQLISYDQLSQIKSLEDGYRCGYDLELPSVNLITFDSLEELYLNAKAKLSDAKHSNFCKLTTPVYELFDKKEISEFKYILYQANITGSSNKSLKTDFKNLLPYTREFTGNNERSSPVKKVSKDNYKEYIINPSFFKTIFTQKLIQLSDCLNWFDLNNIKPNKSLLIKTLFNDLGVSQANIYQTHFKNVELIRNGLTINELINILKITPEYRNKVLKKYIEELSLENIQKNQ